MMQPERFRGTVGGLPVDLYLLRNASGMQVAVTNYGGKLLQIVLPDGTDVLQGYDSLDAVRSGQWAMGAFIGRYANRIRDARFSLEGREVRLAANDGAHSLHGGPRGSFCRVFEAWQTGADRVEMRYTFQDGEEGFPGTLALRLQYVLSEEHALKIQYDALALDKPTVASFTTHGYFNLAGHDAGGIHDHRLQVHASRFLPVDRQLIPTGELRSVAGTPMDLLHSTRLGDVLDRDDEQLRIGRGYDHHFVLERAADGALAPAARVEEPRSGRVMEVWTTEPGLQLYTNNFVDLSKPDRGKGGAVYGLRSALCLEPSRFPDAPNQPHFPSTLLRPGERYAGETQYRFACLQGAE
jgi:aldose 1-epimerase